MDVKCIKVGYLRCNCYIVSKDDECIIIDPGDEAKKIIDNINKKVVCILITHNHFDHIGAKDELCNYYNVKVYDDSNLIEGLNKFSKFEFVVRKNYGHTMDSISFIFENIMFTGDFIFKNAIGRCDVGGDFNAMKKSINEILKYKDNFKIYPGHGVSSYLFDEINYLMKFI